MINPELLKRLRLNNIKKQHYLIKQSSTYYTYEKDDAVVHIHLSNEASPMRIKNNYFVKIVSDASIVPKLNDDISLVKLLDMHVDDVDAYFFQSQLMCEKLKEYYSIYHFNKGLRDIKYNNEFVIIFAPHPEITSVLINQIIMDNFNE